MECDGEIITNLRRKGSSMRQAHAEQASLSKPVWSTAGKVGMLTMLGYLVIALLLLVVKVVQLALGH
jgi:hypothetical protein